MHIRVSIYGITSSYMKVTVPSLPEGASQVKFRAVKSTCPGFMWVTVACGKEQPHNMTRAWATAEHTYKSRCQTPVMTLVITHTIPLF